MNTKMVGISISAESRIGCFMYSVKMKKVLPKGLSLDSESPLTMAPMACSRMPK